MNPIWWKFAALVAAIALISTAMAVWIGPTVALAVALLAMLLLALRDRSNLYSLWRWAENDCATPLPPASGVWDELFAKLYRHNRMIERDNAALHEALASLRRAAQALPDGVVLLNDQNQIQWSNRQADQHFNLKLAADVGQTITNLVRSPDFLAYLAQKEWDLPVILRPRSSGQSGDLVLSVQVVEYGDEQRLLLSRDVTKIERLETMRRDFVANVSHELKTPLTVLAGFLETIREVKLPARQQHHYLDLMSEQADRMQHLVTDLLQLSALEGTKNPGEERLDMAALIGRIEAAARHLSGDRHQLHFSIDTDLNLIGAESEITSALSNLVTNAVRYTPDTGTIEVHWESCDEGARFVVADNGIGIDPEHIDRLTERFYRVDRGRSRESGGTGLGLAIVKHVLTRHQAHLEITSTIGTGSRFAAIFPQRRVVRAAIEDGSANVRAA